MKSQTGAVLGVDDNEYDRDLLTRHLRLHGHNRDYQD
jgi:hypothetical protein